MSTTTISTIKGFPGVPEFLPDSEQHRRMMARAINNLNLGKFNCTIDVTLNASTGATVINDARIGFDSAVTPLMPMSLPASLDIGTIWMDAPKSGFGSTSASIVVHHRIDATTGRKIRFGIFG